MNNTMSTNLIPTGGVGGDTTASNEDDTISP